MPLKILLLVVIMLASFGKAQPTLPSALDLDRVAEISRVVNLHGNTVWSGWKAPPQLLRKADADYLIGHPNPPADFKPVAGINVLGQPVYRREGHLIPVPAATAWLVAGVWSLALPTLEEFQQTIDQVLGVGVVKLDEPTYVAAAVHEAFHAFQMTAMKQELPMFSFQGDEGKMLAELSSQPKLKQQLFLEGQALRGALEASDLSAVFQGVNTFLELRQIRRAQLAPDVAAYEQALEWSEGLARYAEVSLMRLVAGQQSGNDRFVYPATYWNAFLEQVADVSQIPGSLREAYYALGAAQGFVLDRIMDGWKQNALPGGASLEQLLRDLSHRVSSIPASLRDFPIVRLQLAGKTLWLALANQPELWRQGLGGVTKLGGLDGMLFCFPDETRGKFSMKGASMPLEIAFFNKDGVLISMQTMSLCDNDPCPLYGPDRAFKYALETPLGRLSNLPGDSQIEPLP
jgi:uncharacterized membrane protein (UPF0127 family)